MRGKLAKAIRKATGFHPADERAYETTNHTERLERTGRTMYPSGLPEVIRFQLSTVVSTGRRADYQELKQRVLARKHGGGRGCHAA